MNTRISDIVRFSLTTFKASLFPRNGDQFELQRRMVTDSDTLVRSDFDWILTYNPTNIVVIVPPRCLQAW